MKEDIFYRIKDLIKALHPEERALAAKHLKAYETYHTDKSSRMLGVYKTIVKEPDIQLKKLKKIVSPEVSHISFRQLLSRTHARIKESLILEINISREKYYSKIFQKRFQLRKKLVHTKIIRGRGLVNEALISYNNIIAMSKKYELYDELIEALQSKMSIIVTTKGLEAYKDIKNELNFYRNARNNFTEAVALYDEYYAVVNFSSTKKANLKQLKRNVEILTNNAEETNSANIQSLMYLMKFEFNNLTKNYEENRMAAVHFLDLIDQNAALKSKPRQVYILNLLIENQILAIDYKTANEYGNKVIEILEGSKAKNLFICLQLLSLSNYYLGNYQKVNHFHGIMKDFPFYKKEIYLSTKVFYTKAMCYFAKEQFRDALLLLSNMMELEKEKEGWNVWIRIMRILCSIDLLRLSMLDYDIDNFKRYMQRTDKRKDVKPRDKLILKILLALDKNEYNFEKTAKSCKKDLELLRSVKGVLSWQALSPEMIIFHDWFDARKNNRVYKPNFSLYKNRPPLTEEEVYEIQEIELAKER